MRWLTHLDGGPKRVNHAAVSVGHKIYSFGGYCTGENSKEYTSMDVHVLNTTTFRWTKHPVSDLPYFENDDILPYKRYGHTAVVYGDKIYVWGGRNDRSADAVLFCFDTKWHCWTAPQTTGTIPLARDGHTACVWRQYMIIFGGYEEETDSCASSVYALNLDRMEWSYILTSGPEPLPRDFQTAVCISDRMYMFGGRCGYIEEFYPNELWYLDLHTSQWVCPYVTGDIPVGRRSHSSFVYNNKLYIFGGFNSLEEKHYNTLHEFNPVTNVWRLLHPAGQAPCERRRQVSVVVKDRVFLFGGTSPSLTSTYLGDSQDDILVDHSDLHVLDFSPSLKTMAILSVRKHKLDASTLPTCLRMDVMNMFTPNKIVVIRPSNSAG